MRAPIATADAIARSDANLLAASKAYALACSTGDVWEMDGVIVASSGNELRSFNVAFVVRWESGSLERACEWLRSRVSKFRVRIREDVPVDERAIDAAGLRAQGGIPSLVLAPIPGATAPSSLEVRDVTDRAALRDHVAVLASGFDWQPAAPAQIFTERLLADPAWHGYTGYIAGQPAAASQLYVHGGVAGIYYVATVAAYRRRGFGEVITRHAMLAGLDAGCDMASLQASPMGFPIYTRMGFTQASSYRQFVPEEA